MIGVLLMGCAPDLTPSWAYDPIWLEPVLELPEVTDAHGFQTWEIFGPRWERSNRPRHYVCAVLVELDGQSTTCDADPDCTHAWIVTPTVIEDDCVGAVATDDPLFTSTRRMALGGPASGDVPYIGATRTGWIDYGSGWEIHGQAYPDGLDAGMPAGTFDEGEPYAFLPSAAFPFPP